MGNDFRTIIKVQNAHIYFIFNIVILIDNLSSVYSSADVLDQAFLETDKNLKFIIDGIHVNLPDKLRHLGPNEGRVSASPVQFDPPYMDFKESPIGEPNVEQVTLINSDVTKTVHLLSISASTPHFHCSLFQDKIVPSGGNTTFDIVFLAREIGNVENTLFIHTSFGTYKYQVFGVGVPSPYKMEPFLGATIPVNASFSTNIHIYNPHPVDLLITEMYTSGGGALHLELPNSDPTDTTGTTRSSPDFSSGHMDGHPPPPRRPHWHIPAYQTRTVMQLRLAGGSRPANISAFVRIKTNYTDHKSLGFVLPVELVVTAVPGVYCLLNNLNFGILRTLDKPKSLLLSLVNSAEFPLFIKSVKVDPPNSAISVIFKPTRILPGLTSPINVAAVVFDPVKATSSSQWSGNLIVRIKKTNQRLVIPYVADVLHGSMVYDANSTQFFTGDLSAGSVRTQPLQITNTFNFTLVVYNYSLHSLLHKYFKISGFENPVIIPVGETRHLVTLHYQSAAAVADKDNSVISRIGLFSNASLFVIPIFVYTGRLKVTIPYNHEPVSNLDFGTVGIREIRSISFILRNDNPVDVTIGNVSTNWEGATIELVGVERGNGSFLSKKQDVEPSIFPEKFVLRPFHFVELRLTAHFPDSEINFNNSVTLTTQYQALSIHYHFRSVEASIVAVPETLILEDSFPGKESSTLLILRSTFHDFLELQAVVFQPNDSRFRFEASPGRQLPMLLKPLEDTAVGRIVFDAGRYCSDDQRGEEEGACYVGFGTDTPLGTRWHNGFSLPSSLVDIDRAVCSVLHQCWSSLVHRGEHTLFSSLRLDTTLQTGFLSHVKTSLVWPQIVKGTGGGAGGKSKPPRPSPKHPDLGGREWTPGDTEVDFGLTQLGNTSVRELWLTNPADRPVLVQIMPLSHYPRASRLLDLLGLSYFTHQLWGNESGVFSVVEEEEDINNNTEFGSQHSKILLLAPHSHHRVRVYFHPQDENPEESLLVVRNNLTGLETAWLRGRGGHGEVWFGGGTQPDDLQPLVFELTEKHLRNCDKSIQMKGVTPNFTVRRPFIMHNSGKLPVFVRGFSFSGGAEDMHDIEENWCSGFGFEMESCEGFLLPVNSSRKMNIAFTPDFSLHRVQQEMHIHTSLGGPPLNLTVQATLPAHMLHRCSQSLSRPEVELLLWYSLIAMATTLSLCVAGLAYWQADRIYTWDVLRRHQIPCLDLYQPAPSYMPAFPLDTGNSDCEVTASSSATTGPGTGGLKSRQVTPSPPLAPLILQHRSTTTKRRRSHWHSLTQWLSLLLSSSPSALKPKLECSSPTTASNIGISSSSSNSNHIATNKATRIIDSPMKQITPPSPIGTSSPSANNLRTRRRNRAELRNQQQQQQQQNQQQRLASAARYRETSSPIPSEQHQQQLFPWTPDFAPIDIPTHDRCGRRSKKGAVCSNTCTIGKKFVEESLVMKLQTTAILEDNMSISDSSNEEKSNSLNKSLDRAAVITSQKAGHDSDSESTATLPLHMRDDDANDAEDEYEELSGLPDGVDRHFDRPASMITATPTSTSRTTTANCPAASERPITHWIPAIGLAAPVYRVDTPPLQASVEPLQKQQPPLAQNVKKPPPPLAVTKPTFRAAPMTSIVKPVVQQRVQPLPSSNTAPPEPTMSSSYVQPVTNTLSECNIMTDNKARVSGPPPNSSNHSDATSTGASSPGGNFAQLHHHHHHHHHHAHLEVAMSAAAAAAHHRPPGAPPTAPPTVHHPRPPPPPQVWTTSPPPAPMFHPHQRMMHPPATHVIMSGPPPPQHMRHHMQASPPPLGVAHMQQGMQAGPPVYGQRLFNPGMFSYPNSRPGMMCPPPSMPAGMNCRHRAPCPSHSLARPPAHCVTVASNITNEGGHKYELPRMTQDRRLSMLEYERRYQAAASSSSTSLSNQPNIISEEVSDMSQMVGEVTSGNSVDGNSLGAVSRRWNRTEPHPIPRNIWEEVEPGSREDYIANNLLPPNLLGGDSLGYNSEDSMITWIPASHNKTTLSSMATDERGL